MGTIRFFLRTDKPDKKDGRLSIQLAYQISQERERFQTKEKVWPQSWDQENQIVRFYSSRRELKKAFDQHESDLLSEKNIITWPKVDFNKLPIAKEVDEINNYLNSLKIKIRNEEKKRELAGIIEYSPKEIINELRNVRPKLKAEGPTNEVFNYIDKYIEDHRAIREPGSLQVYRSLKNHLLAFQSHYNVRIRFADLDSSFFRKFQNFLAIPRKEKIQSKKNSKSETLTDNEKPQEKYRTISLNNTTIGKQLSTLRTFIGYAVAEKIHVSDDYKNFKIKKPKLEVIALTNEEFERLYNHDLSGSKRLARVRDIFCFSCVTGLRYSDLNQLRREHIKGDEIRLNIKKTRTNLIIPLNTYSLEILSRYSNNQLPLPVSGQLKLISNQVLNRYIKELCKIVGISEPIEIVRMRGEKREAIVYPKYELISIHTGRKSFVTISLERGISIPEVMATSGHSDYRSFSRYVNVAEKQKKESMQKAWGSINRDTSINSNMKVA